MHKRHSTLFYLHAKRKFGGIFSTFVVGHFIAFTLDFVLVLQLLFLNFVFYKLSQSAPGAWLSCSSRLDVQTASLLDVS